MSRHREGFTLQGEVDPLWTGEQEEVTDYTMYPDHPLRDVPEFVLQPARTYLAAAAFWRDIPEDLVMPLADAITTSILEAGLLTWEGKT